MVTNVKQNLRKSVESKDVIGTAIMSSDCLKGINMTYWQVQEDLKKASNITDDNYIEIICKHPCGNADTYLLTTAKRVKSLPSR